MALTSVSPCPQREQFPILLLTYSFLILSHLGLTTFPFAIFIFVVPATLFTLLSLLVEFNCLQHPYFPTFQTSNQIFLQNEYCPNMEAMMFY